MHSFPVPASCSHDGGSEASLHRAVTMVGVRLPCIVLSRWREWGFPASCCHDGGSEVRVGSTLDMLSGLTIGVTNMSILQPH